MSESVEEYLEAILSFNEEHRRAKNSELAEKLRVAPASVTQMIQRLADEGLVIYEPYRGVILTGRGTARAQRTTRRHRLLERWLQNELKIPREKVHAEACRIEHTLSDEVAAALCMSLGNPERCTDDEKLIPLCTFDLPDCSRCEEVRASEESSMLRTQLSNLTEREEARVVFLRERGAPQRRRLESHGLAAGARVEIIKAEPFTGPMEVRVDGKSVVVPRSHAERVVVEFKSEGNPRVHPHGPYHEKQTQ